MRAGPGRLPRASTVSTAGRAPGALSPGPRGASPHRGDGLAEPPPGPALTRGADPGSQRQQAAPGPRPGGEGGGGGGAESPAEPQQHQPRGPAGAPDPPEAGGRGAQPARGAAGRHLGPCAALRLRPPARRTRAKARSTAPARKLCPAARGEHCACFRAAAKGAGLRGGFVAPVRPLVEKPVFPRLLLAPYF